MDVWSLIQNGFFEKACEVADSEYEQTGNIFILRNKVYALLHLKQYDEVISLTEFLIKERNGESDTDFIFCGIAYWLTKNYYKAIQIWQSAEDCKYTDAAGGVELQVILYFAGVKSNDKKLIGKSSKKLARLLKGKQAANWPAPLGRFMLNELTQIELQNNISQTPVLRERQLCQADFVKAIKELEKGNEIGYRNELQNCISYGSSSYLEQLYYLAKGEIERNS